MLHQCLCIVQRMQIACMQSGAEPHHVLFENTCPKRDTDNRVCSHAAEGVHLCQLLLHWQVGAHIHTVTKEEYTKVGSEALLQQLADQLRHQGKKPYCIPVGGSSPLGCWGYLEAVREIQEQAGNLGITDIALVSCISLTQQCHAVLCSVAINEDDTPVTSMLAFSLPSTIVL